MHVNPEHIQVVHNPARQRFEITIDGQVAVAEYMISKEKIIFTHTEVPPSLEGNGLASTLAKTALNYARQQHYRVMPLCPYMASYMRTHPEYQDLLLPGFRVGS